MEMHMTDHDWMHAQGGIISPPILVVAAPGCGFAFTAAIARGFALREVVFP